MNTKNNMARALWVGVLLVLSIACTLSTFGQAPPTSNQNPATIVGPVVSDPVIPMVIDVDLRDLPKPHQWKPGDPIREVPRRRYGMVPPYAEPDRLDPLLAIQDDAPPRIPMRDFDMPILNFDGQGFTGVNPPDTVGDVGINYYIQAVNSGGGSVYTIYDKTDGSVAAGPFTLDNLGAGVCTSGAGDPIVLYDAQASRWLISEFAPQGSNTLCVYISQTSDPIAGGWFNYSFPTPNFPDYPKYGVWPDAYYVTSNESGPSAIYALDRIQMLAGAAATSQRFTAPDLSGFGFQALTPTDLDGDPPPVGAPNYIMRHRDDEPHNPGANDPSQDFLEIYEFHVDWVTPGNSTLTGPTNIAVTEFDSSLCGLTSFSCFDQPGGGSDLDPLREVIMHRLQYRNFGTHQTLVGNLVTDVNGSDLGGVRWFELRNTGGGWTLFQEGTYSPDSVNRWMGSIAMDESGNMALGYNVSSDSVSPGLRYVGRLDDDPLGTMPQGEYILVDGSASNNSNRYGDYASLNLDPEDGCTFWFTGEYNASGSWSTRIGNFRFDSCGCVPPDAPTALAAANNGDNQVDLSWTASAGATSYNVYRAVGSCPQGSYQQIATGIVGTSYSDTTVSGGTTYSYVVRAYDAVEDCESDQSNCDSETATGLCLLPPDFSGVDAVTNLQLQSCTLDVSWMPATSNCGLRGGLVYNVYRDIISGFVPGAGNLIATCVAGTSYVDTDIDPLTTYYYVVRSEDSSGNGSGPCAGGNEDTNTEERSAAASGPNTDLFSDDMESGAANWVTAALAADTGTNPWSMVTTASNSPITSWFCSDEAVVKDQVVGLASAINAIPPGAPAVLEFWHRPDTELNWDGGVLEYSTDGGATWFDILQGDGGAIPADPARFLEGGYNLTLNASANPLGGRPAWSGSNASFSKVSVDASDFSGSSVLFRWRMGCDGSVSATGWWVDDVLLFAGSSCENVCADLLLQLPLWRVTLDVLDLIPCID